MPAAGSRTRSLRRYARLLDRVRGSARPVARTVLAPASPFASLAVVSGAFNPPTLAHRALAGAALGRGFDAAVFALGTVTLDKTETGLALEDRIALLADLVAGDPRLGVVVHNAGLYADQATALRRRFPGLDDLAFVVGLDKLPQILDARYYADLRIGLARLLSSARLLVAPRGRQHRGDFLELCARPAVEPWRGRIHWLPLAQRWRDISATDARALLRRGGGGANLLPASWTTRLDELGAFDPERRVSYLARVERIRAAAVPQKKRAAQSASRKRSPRSARFA